MTVSVDIEVARRAATLVAPADTVFDAASTHPWVLVIEDHHAARKSVVLGLKGDGQIEILDGVAAGERLIRTASNPSLGQRVRVAATKQPRS